MERPDEVLARLGVDAGLAADRRVHHRQQRRRNVVDPHSPHPRRRDEAREIRGGAATETHHRVGARETDLAEHFPAESRDRKLLAVLGIGDLDTVCVDPGVGERFPDRLGGRRECGLVEDGDGTGAGQCLHEVAQQPASDDDGIGIGGVDIDAYRFGHGVMLRFSGVVSAGAASCTAPSLVRTCWTTRPGLRPSVRTLMVADCR